MNEARYIQRIREVREGFMLVGKAHQDGHPACETCRFCQPYMELGSVPVVVDTSCTLGYSGEAPELCPALNAIEHCCPECDGKKTANGPPCTNCDGTGWLDEHGEPMKEKTQ